MLRRMTKKEGNARIVVNFPNEFSPPRREEINCRERCKKDEGYGEGTSDGSQKPIVDDRSGRIGEDCKEPCVHCSRDQRQNDHRDKLQSEPKRIWSVSRS